MKLLMCKKCKDVFRLFEFTRSCKCGSVSGKYSDILNAEYSGDDAIPIGFANSTLLDALDNQPEEGMGEKFIAFVIPKKCDTFIKK